MLKLDMYLAKVPLVQGVQWYDCMGQRLFALYGEDGSPAASFMAYLWRDGGTHFGDISLGVGGLVLAGLDLFYGIRLYAYDSEDVVYNKVQKGLEEIINAAGLE